MNYSVKSIISFVLVYLAAASASYGFFTLQTSSSPNLASPATPPEDPTKISTILDIQPDEPKTEVCPLNGIKYTVTERKAWEKRRPLTIMIENHLEARPQSGISFADIVYEVIAEGGITRFMGVFYCDTVSQNLTIGPVRSARTYFLDWASEYGKYPLYVHVGGANTPNKANALGQIVDYGWSGANDLNQFALSVKECRRDYSRIGHQVATEHTMYCFSEALWKKAAQRGFEAESSEGDLWTDYFQPWKFTQAESKPDQPATDITFDFWDDFSQYTVNWVYNSDSQAYKRNNGGQPHLDRNTNNQIEAATIIIQFTAETGPIDDLKHLLYRTTGSGKALIFSHGQAQKATWSKKSRLARTIFKDSRGKIFQFQPGKIWIEVVAQGNKINYQ